jgi:hypothetical protein
MRLKAWKSIIQEMYQMRWVGGRIRDKASKLKNSFILTCDGGADGKDGVCNIIVMPSMAIKQ